MSFLPVINLSPDSLLVTLLNPISNLILASPLPSYGLTIIIFTLLIRTSLSVPIAYWQKGRMKRMMDVVVPALKKYNAEEKLSLMKSCRKEGVGYEVYVTRLKAAMASKAKALHKSHGTNPTITTYAPLAFTIPTILFFSAAIRRAMTIDGSTMSSEIFGIGDFTFMLGEESVALAILGAGVGLINAEVFERKFGDRKVGEEDRALMKGLREGDGEGTVAGSGEGEGVVVIKGQGIGAERGEKPGPVLPVTASSLVVPAPTPTPTPIPTPSIAPPRARPILPPPPPRSSTRKFTTTPPASYPPTSPKTVELPNTQSAPPSAARDRLTLWILRGMAVAFFFVGSTIPSGVVLFWVTSLVFTLGQQTYLREVGKKARKKAIGEIIAKAKAGRKPS